MIALLWHGGDEKWFRVVRDKKRAVHYESKWEKERGRIRKQKNRLRVLPVKSVDRTRVGIGGTIRREKRKSINFIQGYSHRAQPEPRAELYIFWQATITIPWRQQKRQCKSLQGTRGKQVLLSKWQPAERERTGTKRFETFSSFRYPKWRKLLQLRQTSEKIDFFCHNKQTTRENVTTIFPLIASRSPTSDENSAKRWSCFARNEKCRFDFDLCVKFFAWRQLGRFEFLGGSSSRIRSNSNFLAQTYRPILVMVVACWPEAFQELQKGCSKYGQRRRTNTKGRKPNKLWLEDVSWPRFLLCSAGLLLTPYLLEWNCGADAHLG